MRENGEIPQSPPRADLNTFSFLRFAPILCLLCRSSATAPTFCAEGSRWCLLGCETSRT